MGIVIHIWSVLEEPDAALPFLQMQAQPTVFTFEMQAEPAATTFIWLGLPCITSLANRRRIVHYLSAVLDLSIAELLYYVTSVTLGAGTNPVDCMTGAHRSHKSLYLLSSPTRVL